MDPITAGILLSMGSQVLGGIVGRKRKKKVRKAKRKALKQLTPEAYAANAAGIQGALAGQQGGLNPAQMASSNLGTALEGAAPMASANANMVYRQGIGEANDTNAYDMLTSLSGLGGDALLTYGLRK